MMKQNEEHLAALIERTGRLLNTEAHAEGLLPVQWEVLRYLARANRFSRTAGATTAYLGLTKGTVSQTLKTLESRGLISKQADPTDRRSKRLKLTARGSRLLARDPLRLTVDALSRLNADERESLETVLESFLSNRLKAQDRRPFGQCRTCRYFAARHSRGNPHYCQLLKEKLTDDDARSICYEQLDV